MAYLARFLAVGCALLVCASCLGDPAGAGPQAPDFIRDIQPIFQSECYKCHSAQKPKGHLRLDSRELAMKGGSSGVAIEPGKGKDSYLVQRLRGEGGEDQMPLKRPALSPGQIMLVQRWIDQGAVWPDSVANSGAKVEKHWAYVMPRRPAIPTTGDPSWVRNPIDAFVLARLEKEGLHPSPEADRPTLIRRLSLDLTGLPPSPKEVDDFVHDTSPDAYEKLVDRLLASPHFGEQWARHWLDLARYADTNGYEKDRPRSIWPYRDWVINALNADMPFNQFTVEQIAGDMLPHATPAQRIATGFNRNTMTNEEGGIDIEEFRFKSVVDRVQTTMNVWMGQTFQCAQCHNHKYDPFTQKEYYRFFALLNNTSESDGYDIPDKAIAARRHEQQEKIDKLVADRAKDFPTHKPKIEWVAIRPGQVHSTAAHLTILDDGSVIASGPRSATDTYTVTAPLAAGDIQQLKLVMMTDPSFPKGGPGRNGAGNGNFVLTDFKVLAIDANGKPVAAKLSAPHADINQGGFDIARAIDADPHTGWAVDDGSKHINQNHEATFAVAWPASVDPKQPVQFVLDQQYADHTIGRFKLLAGVDEAMPKTNEPVEEQRRHYLAQRFAEWEKAAAPKAGHWQLIVPDSAQSKNSAILEKQPDGSILAKFDKPNTDVYTLEFDAPPSNITALRLEVLPDPSLPEDGPGRAPLFSPGDFLLSEFQASTASAEKPGGWQDVKFASASHSYAGPNRSAAQAIDGKVDTGWTVAGHIGQPSRAVFVPAAPIQITAGGKLRIALLQIGIHQMTIGRFRLWATSDPQPKPASDLPPEVEEALVLSPGARSAMQNDRLMHYFLTVAPELADQNRRIAALRKSMPRFHTTLVMEERDPAHRRVTHLHHRGEYLSTREVVTPGTPAVLPPMNVSPGKVPDRLDLAHWLVDKDNPLVGRVTMNRVWYRLFGRGIVATLDDFGVQGSRPSHPELLDYLATEFVARNWSTKAMIRLMVTSATYRQSSRVTPELLKRDPQNVLLARGPRFRVDAETVRDIALSAAGLLSSKIGGPSVFPPQPPGITELSYGPMDWITSTGADRYRRGLYTFLKRTSPYPGLTTFDAPNADVTCPMRPRSNTPLQALQTLNDTVFIEAAQGMARRLAKQGPKDLPGRITLAFRLCTARAPSPKELSAVEAFFQKQLAHFRKQPAQAAQFALSDPKKPPKDQDVTELAAWTAVSRALLNLDETITKE